MLIVVVVDAVVCAVWAGSLAARCGRAVERARFAGFVFGPFGVLFEALRLCPADEEAQPHHPDVC